MIQLQQKFAQKVKEMAFRATSNGQVDIGSLPVLPLGQGTEKENLGTACLFEDLYSPLDIFPVALGKLYFFTLSLSLFPCRLTLPIETLSLSPAP